MLLVACGSELRREPEAAADVIGLVPGSVRQMSLPLHQVPSGRRHRPCTVQIHKLSEEPAVGASIYKVSKRERTFTFLHGG